MCNIPKPSHPSPDRIRENWQNLNGQWDFSLNSDALDKKITVPFSWTCPLSGIGADEDGVGYYRKFVKKSREGMRIFIVFGAVDYYANLYINGFDAGHHAGGYARFEFDITDFWKDDSENEILLVAEDKSESYQTYGKQGYGNSRGIWQTVYLELRCVNYIDSFKITTELDGTVKINCNIKSDEEYVLRAEFESYAAEVKNSDSLVLNIKDPKLWSPENPYLYHGTLSLITSSGTDTISTYFGIRTVGTMRFDKDGHKFITLNGKPVYINGVLDQSYNPEGHFTLPTDEECRNEILRIKEAGFNLTRIHIKPEEPLKLYYADMYGLLVMADIPSFWASPTPLAKKLFEEQMYECANRDINHPSIIYWVIFNESWGLLTKDTPSASEGVFEKTTQQWVRRCYRDFKKYDPTRLVEDNSPCRRDHIETDVNTWHFYANGYENVKNIINYYADGCYDGSEINFIAPNTCGDVVCMNSECGNVWGIDGNAGDSDISWHYKYMLNQFRLHPKMGGFVFTEFHDVTNEFNGFYRLNNDKKYFGYDFYVPGMTVCDLHAKTIPLYDAPPMQTLDAKSEIEIPVYISCFEPDRLNKPLTIKYELAFLKEDEFEIYDKKSFVSSPTRISVNFADNIKLHMPNENGIAVLRIYLTDKEDIISRTFVCFDVIKKDFENNSCTVNPASFTGSSFEKTFLCQQGRKLNCLGEGKISFDVDISKLEENESLTLTFEASSRFTLAHDILDTKKAGTDLTLMLGGECNRGDNPNSFYMTDEETHEGSLDVYADDILLKSFVMPDCPADSRGSLSWHYQPKDNKLDEAGSYGYLYRVQIPRSIYSGKKSITLSFKADKGLSLFGAKSGRYPVDINIK